ncbi:MAG: hypothetical protein V7723_06200 [Sneathiella sp.]|uniref:hypothetical protein n=1 Tax=Sneathiella sp. TaxID=1964365 RepID=UPI0030028A1A
MSYGLGLSEKKQARQRRNRFFKFVFYLLVIAGVGVYGYYEGQAEGNRQIANVEDQVLVLTKENNRLNDQTRAALDKQSSALAEARVWRDKFENEIPSGPTLEILELVQQRLAGGLEPERLKTLIGLAENSQNCDPAPETKRFIVNTAIFNSPGNSVSLGKGSITVTGNGIATVNAEKKIEAWYDPTRPVEIIFTQLGGKKEVLTGVLPLHKSVVFGGNEYRFSILSGKQSFATISATRCDFP